MGYADLALGLTLSSMLWLQIAGRFIPFRPLYSRFPSYHPTLHRSPYINRLTRLYVILVLFAIQVSEECLTALRIDIVEVDVNRSWKSHLTVPSFNLFLRL